MARVTKAGLQAENEILRRALEAILAASSGDQAEQGAALRLREVAELARQALGDKTTVTAGEIPGGDLVISEGQSLREAVEEVTTGRGSEQETGG